MIGVVVKKDGGNKVKGKKDKKKVWKDKGEHECNEVGKDDVRKRMSLENERKERRK